MSQQQQEEQMSSDKTTKRAVEIIAEFGDKTKKGLGRHAHDLLSPKEAADIIECSVDDLGDLRRNGWLGFDPKNDIGRAHRYERWQVVLIKRHRRRYRRDQ